MTVIRMKMGENKKITLKHNGSSQLENVSGNESEGTENKSVLAKINVHSIEEKFRHSPDMPRNWCASCKPEQRRSIETNKKKTSNEKWEKYGHLFHNIHGCVFFLWFCLFVWNAFYRIKFDAHIFQMRIKNEKIVWKN